MKKYKKYIILTILLQLIYSINLSANSNNSEYPFTGEFGDSVLISIEDLKLANIKMMEGNYDKKIIEDYEKLVAELQIKIQNQNAIIFSTNIERDNISKEKEYYYKKYKLNNTLMKIFGSTTIGISLLFFILI